MYKMADEYKIYKYKTPRTLKSGEVKEYDVVIKRKVVLKDRADYKMRIKYNVDDRISEETRAGVYRDYLCGKKKGAIADDFGLSYYIITKIINEGRATELSKTIAADGAI